MRCQCHRGAACRLVPSPLVCTFSVRLSAFTFISGSVAMKPALFVALR